MVAFTNLFVCIASLVLFTVQGVFASPAPLVNGIARRQVVDASDAFGIDLAASETPIITAAKNSTKNMTAISSSIIPSSCSNSCSNSSLTALTSCTTGGCECTTAVYSDVQSCLSCLVTQNNLANGTAQNLLQEYGLTCSQLGHTLAGAFSGALPQFSTFGVFGTAVAALALSVVL